MKHLFVTQHKKTWSIDLMCRVLGVIRQGYYHYRQRSYQNLKYKTPKQVEEEYRLVA